MITAKEGARRRLKKKNLNCSGIFSDSEDVMVEKEWEEEIFKIKKEKCRKHRSSGRSYFL